MASYIRVGAPSLQRNRSQGVGGNQKTKATTKKSWDLLQHINWVPGLIVSGSCGNRLLPPRLENKRRGKKKIKGSFMTV